jgi:cell division transport system permease protein
VRAQFVLSEMFIGLRHNLTMTIALVITTALSLALVGAALLMRTQVGNLKDFWYGKIEVSIFLCDPISDTPQCHKTAVKDDQREAIQSALLANPVVQKVYFESKEEAYKHFLELFKNSPDLTRNVSPDALPPSFRVKLKDPKQFDVVQSEFQDMPGVDQVADQSKGLKPLFKTFDGLTTIAIFVAVITLIASVLLIFNAIRVAAFSRRRETGIMRLVGASNLYIRLPFLLEGAFAGLIGGAIAAVFLALFWAFLVQNVLRPNIRFINWISWSDTWHVFPLLFLIGVLLSTLSSFLAIQRHLRV